MRNGFARVGILGAMALAACQTQTAAPAAAVVDTVRIRAALDSLAAAVGQAHATGDAEAYAATWAADGIMSAPGSPMVEGREAIVAAFRSQPPLPPGATMSINPMELRVLSDDWAYAFGVDTLTITPPGAATPRKETSTFLVLLKRTPEGWKTYREVLSANQATEAAPK